MIRIRTKFIVVLRSVVLDQFSGLDYFFIHPPKCLNLNEFDVIPQCFVSASLVLLSASVVFVTASLDRQCYFFYFKVCPRSVLNIKRFVSHQCFVSVLLVFRQFLHYIDFIFGKSTTITLLSLYDDSNNFHKSYFPDISILTSYTNVSILLGHPVQPPCYMRITYTG